MKILSCEFNIDTACVELKFADGTLISIDCTAVENEVADNMYQRSELDWLIYNAPIEFADLILNGDPEKYLKTVEGESSMCFGLHLRIEHIFIFLVNKLHFRVITY